MLTFSMMVGLPASGKSTLAKALLKNNNNTILISSDELRKELFNNINDTEHNTKLFNEINKRIKNALSKGISVIYDATNISWKKRRQLLWDIKKYNPYNQCYLMATPYEVCLENNKSRERIVPEYVIRRMYKDFYIPQHYEGWNNIKIIYRKEYKQSNYKDLFYGESGLNIINQDNPHHTLTIGEHCLKCHENIFSYEYLDDKYCLSLAGLFHDIGKKFTKSFKNAKGEITDMAHYYNHQLVSAYDSMFYLLGQKSLSEIELLRIIKYITWHMQPFFINTEKAKDKFINLVGQDFYENLIILHKADIEAK